ncbi:MULTISPECIES: flagellar basal body P-ring formation chaperone FlgA [Ferrimonas]|uniref:flagellar basal body P-ring formation chaperone FlgA n=1 Tax=Ferrimonas TaxID=44011 RepID=UPI00068740F7|nr:MULTISPECIES: flagellar basal body P-ring formation chaperone FlgA [Ferrimonas]USD36265.1 flagellar basal body P-ring formation protein FlgA [Ferrimonas sp. SCSIO 43195]
MAALPLAGSVPALASPAKAGEQIGAAVEQQLQRQVQQWQHDQPGRWQPTSITVVLPRGVERLSPCEAPLSVDGNANGFPGGQQQRQVSCPTPAWSLFVRAKVVMTATIPVARQKLVADQPISAEQLTWQQHQFRQRDRATLMTPDAIDGLRPKRSIRAGDPIRAGQLQSPLWVEKGQEVIIEASDGSFVASTKGVALAAGSQGEAIRVRNLSSGKQVSAYVVAPGRVKTNF